VTGTVVDSNVLLDVLSHDPTWMEWSANALEETADASPLIINPVIYAEVSYRYSRKEDLEAALPEVLQREPIPYDAAFLAAKAHAIYRRRRGVKVSPCVDGSPLARRYECFCKAGRCGHVFDLLMRRTWAAGHNAFRGNRVPTNSTRSKRDGDYGFSRSPVSTGLLHHTRSALPNSVGVTRLIGQAVRSSGSLYF